jgi:hypothetical protein
MSTSRSEAWLSSNSDVGQSLTHAAQQLGGRLSDVEASGFAADFGSSFGYRMLGAYLQAGRRRFPIRLRIVIEPRSSDGTRITATFTSTEGWYIGRAPAFGRLFNQRCDEILAALAAAGSDGCE